MNAATWGRGDTRRITTRDFPAEILALVDQRQGGRYCENCRGGGHPETEPLELDHKQPLSKGGDNHWTNLRWLCAPCNKGRGARRRPPAIPRHARGLR